MKLWDMLFFRLSCLYLALVLGSCNQFSSGCSLPPEPGGPFAFNLGYEILNEAELPAEWMFSALDGPIKLIKDTSVALSGQNCLHYSLQSGGDEKIMSSSSLLVDVVKEHLTLSVFVKTAAGENFAYGFFYQSVDPYGTATPQFTRLEGRNSSNFSEWKQCTLEIPVDDLVGEFLVFGFWASGTGELWLDEWNIEVDNNCYTAAVEKSIPALDEVAKNYLEQNAVVFESPRNPEKAIDYSWVAKEAEEADVILLGEATHGTSEFALTRSKLTEYLIEHHGFTTVIIEANLPEVEYLNQQLTKHLSTDQLKLEINKLHFWIYRTSEFLSFLLWLNEYNVTHGKSLRLAGCDMQYADFAVDELVGNLASVPELSEGAILDEWRSLLLEQDVSAAGITEVSEIITKVLYERPDHPQVTDLEWMLHYCAVIDSALKLASGTVAPAFRDQQMAENIEWLTKRTPSGKAVVWAHNVHVANDNRAIGYWLKRNGNVGKVFSLAMTGGAGRYSGIDVMRQELAEGRFKSPAFDSWEFEFGNLNRGNIYLRLDEQASFLDKYSRRRLRSIGAVVTPKQFMPVNLTERFDAIMYFDSTAAVSLY